MEKNYKQRRQQLITAIATGDPEVIRRLDEEEVQRYWRKKILAEWDGVSLWEVYGFFDFLFKDMPKLLNTDQLANLIAKYDFSVFDIGHNADINTLYSEQDRESDYLSKAERPAYYKKVLQNIIDNSPWQDRRWSMIEEHRNQASKRNEAAIANQQENQ